MITIVDGVICCLWGLALCGGSTDSGLRIRAIDVGSDASKVVVHAGHCYTIRPDFNTCGTVLAAGSYTTVAGCSDPACTPATTCPIQPCATTSTSYAIGGLAGVVGPSVAGGPWSCRINGCSTQTGAWDNLVYRNGNHASTGCPGTGTWFIDNNLYTPGGFSPEIALSDGNKLCVSCTLSCAGHFGTDLGWYIDIGLGSACDPDAPGATATYYNPGPSPAGTFSLVRGGATINWPATITAS